MQCVEVGKMNNGSMPQNTYISIKYMSFLVECRWLFSWPGLWAATANPFPGIMPLLICHLFHACFCRLFLPHYGFMQTWKSEQAAAWWMPVYVICQFMSLIAHWRTIENSLVHCGVLTSFCELFSVKDDQKLWKILFIYSLSPILKR